MGCFNSTNRKLTVDLEIFKLYTVHNDVYDVYDTYEINIKNKRFKVLGLAKYIYDDTIQFFLNTTTNIFIIIKFMENSRVSVHRGTAIELYTTQLSSEKYEKYIQEMSKIEKMWNYF